MSAIQALQRLQYSLEVMKASEKMPKRRGYEGRHQKSHTYKSLSDSKIKLSCLTIIFSASGPHRHFCVLRLYDFLAGEKYRMYHIFENILRKTTGPTDQLEI